MLGLLSELLSCTFLAILPAPCTALFHVSPTSSAWQPSTGSNTQLALLADDHEVNASGPSCAPLTNVEGTHYIISVLAGSPPQRFKLIPDTGSPWVIIADSNCSVCNCGKHAGNYCFKESKSSSLSIHVDQAGLMESHQLSFGSGPISIVVATDEIRIDGTPYHHLMESGVLLMIDNGLTFSGPFEGLLGLALPEYKLDASVTMGSSAHSYKDGFLHRSGVNSFSVCLSDKGWSGSGGVLRFNAPRAEKTIGITGNTMHWQVGFYGATIGKATTPLEFCQTAAVGDNSPCAAIVDSGTTYVLGPSFQIYQLFDGICDHWDRCSKKYSDVMINVNKAKELLKMKNNTNAQQPNSISKSQIFQLLLNECHSWIGKSKGLEEMPPLTFTIKGRDGKEELLIVDPWDYIVSEKTYRTEIAYSKMGGLSYATGWERSNKKAWACTAAFATMEFPTHGNGPAWIFGLPFFYSHVVSYNSDTHPPSISFQRGKCGGCDRTHLMHRSKPTSLQYPRKMHGEPRLPKQAHKVGL